MRKNAAGSTTEVSMFEKAPISAIAEPVMGGGNERGLWGKCMGEGGGGYGKKGGWQRRGWDRSGKLLRHLLWNQVPKLGKLQAIKAPTASSVTLTAESNMIPWGAKG